MKHILVVEDEQHLAIGIKYNLEAEGYRVTVAGSGQEALATIDADDASVDLVVLDLMLPGMSGYAVCETLRAKGHDMPVLILSARTLSEDRTRGFDSGADQYMMKPFDLVEFLTRIRNLLALYSRRSDPGNRQPLRSAEYQFGDAKVNFETFDVSVRGESVRMTQLEMRLLQYFVENEGRVIPRQELLEKVWGRRGRLNTRATDQFIRRLRKFFETDPANPRHFLTIRDAGYRFVAAGV